MYSNGVKVNDLCTNKSLKIFMYLPEKKEFERVFAHEFVLAFSQYCPRVLCNYEVKNINTHMSW